MKLAGSKMFSVITYRKCMKGSGGEDIGCYLSQKSVQDVRIGVVMLLFGTDYVTAAIGMLGIGFIVGDFPVVNRSSG